MEKKERNHEYGVHYVSPGGNGVLIVTHAKSREEAIFHATRELFDTLSQEYWTVYNYHKISFSDEIEEEA
jgi:hypothetical protein